MIERVDPGWQVLIEAFAEIAERPVWDSATGSLLWVDITAGSIHRSAPDHARGMAREPHLQPWTDLAFPLGASVGAVALRDDGGLIAGVDATIRFVNASMQDDRDPIALDLPPGHRLNDGVCDPAGRFLIGTAGSSDDGVLWSVDADGEVRVLLQSVTESNGLGWSADGTVLYYIDSGAPLIQCYAYDPCSGDVTRRLPDLIDLSDRPGVPDGLIVDADGCLWVPQWQGSELAQISPAGQVQRRWSVPVSQPTCAAVIGPSLGTLVLATSWETMDEADRAAEPWAGHLLVAGQEVRGAEAFRFGMHGATPRA